MQYTAYSRVTINGEKADDDAPPFQLATPPGFQVNHIPKGNLVNTYVPGTVFEQKTPTIKYTKVRENKKKGRFAGARTRVLKLKAALNLFGPAVCFSFFGENSLTVHTAQARVTHGTRHAARPK